MSTTPTLYVKESLRRWEDSQGHINFGPIHERPATHDELIAAMPRCGTCGHREDELENGRYFCLTKGWVKPDFGCTEHKEKL